MAWDLQKCTLSLDLASAGLLGAVDSVQGPPGVSVLMPHCSAAHSSCAGLTASHRR